MTTPQFTLNFILMLTIILGMTGCLSTEERNALELREKRHYSALIGPEKPNHYIQEKEN